MSSEGVKCEIKREEKVGLMSYKEVQCYAKSVQALE